MKDILAHKTDSTFPSSKVFGEYFISKPYNLSRVDDWEFYKNRDVRIYIYTYIHIYICIYIYMKDAERIQYEETRLLLTG